MEITSMQINSSLESIFSPPQLHCTDAPPPNINIYLVLLVLIIDV